MLFFVKDQRLKVGKSWTEIGQKLDKIRALELNKLFYDKKGLSKWQFCASLLLENCPKVCLKVCLKVCGFFLQMTNWRLCPISGNFSKFLAISCNFLQFSASNWRRIAHSQKQKLTGLLM